MPLLRTGSRWLCRGLCSSALLLVGLTQALAEEQTTQSSLEALLLGTDGLTPVKAEEKLLTGSRIVFESQSPGDHYLHLLQETAGQWQIIHPPVGQVFLPKAGKTRIAPWPDPQNPTDAPSPGFGADGMGQVRYVLVATALPRDVPSDTQVQSLELFFTSPPHLNLPSGERVEILGELELNWPPEDFEDPSSGPDPNTADNEQANAKPPPTPSSKDEDGLETAR